jgi:hypothetical protein
MDESADQQQHGEAQQNAMAACRSSRVSALSLVFAAGLQLKLAFTSLSYANQNNYA